MDAKLCGIAGMTCCFCTIWVTQHRTWTAGDSAGWTTLTGGKLRGEEGKERRPDAEAEETPSSRKTPPLPSILLANVRSLRNKLDKLQAVISCQWAYNKASLICLTETRLDNTIADSELSLDGFGTPLRLDRNSVSSLKRHGGGLCVYFNKGWSRTTDLKKTPCTPDIELLAVSFRPKYLPQEFGQLALVLVYLRPSGKVTCVSGHSYVRPSNRRGILRLPYSHLRGIQWLQAK